MFNIDFYLKIHIKLDFENIDQFHIEIEFQNRNILLNTLQKVSVLLHSLRFKPFFPFESYHIYSHIETYKLLEVILFEHGLALI